MSQPTINDEVRVFPAGYPSELESEAISPGQFRIRVRPIRPQDASALVRFHIHLSDRSCYLRFFSFHPHLLPKEIERFTQVDYRDRLALVAEHDGQIVAVARYDRLQEPSEAEVAFVVADECQHHGIGSLLLDELAAAARERGVTTFLADTLEENRTMLGVFNHSGFPITTHDEYGTISLRFSIARTPPYEAALARRRRDWLLTPVAESANSAPISVEG